MEKERIVETLQQLRTELSTARSIDPETRALVRSLTDEIDGLLDQKENSGDVDAEPVTSGLRDLVLKFEGDHPQLSIAVGKVADALAAMGI